MMREYWRLTALFLVACNVSACSALHTPDGIAEATSIIVSPKYVGQSPLPTAQFETSDDFWAAFRSPELTALIEQSESSNQNIAVAVAQVDQSEAQIDAAFSTLLPGGSIQTNGTWARGSALAAGAPPGVKLPNTHLFQAGLAASYEIDFWGKNAAGFRAAQDTALASRYNVETVRLTATAQTALAYLSVVSLQDQLVVARENVRSARKVAENLGKLVKAGSATQIDLAQQETLVLQQQATVPQLNRAIGETTSAIAALIGVQAGNVHIATTSLDSLRVPLVDTGLTTDLLRRRPDVAGAEAQVLAAAENVTMAKAAMLPSVTLNTENGYEGVSLLHLISPEAALYQVVAGVTQPLLDEVRLAAQLRGEESVRRELIATYKQSILSALSDVQTALTDLRTSGEQLAFARGAANKAKRAYDLSSEQLAAGQLDFTTTLNAQTLYFQSIAGVKQIQLLYFQSAVALFRALGGGWIPNQSEFQVSSNQAVQCSSSQSCISKGTHSP